MPKPPFSVIVIFNCDTLPQVDRFDRDKRREVLEEGIQRLSNRFPAINFGNRNTLACSVDVMLAEDEAADLVEFFDENKELGRYMFDAPVLRAARRH